MSVIDLVPRAEQVRDETTAGANTASRVGGLLVDMIQDTAQDINTLASSVSLLPSTPFDSVEWDGGQENNTGNQALVFKCKNVEVGRIAIKTAAEGYSGLLSAALYAKLNNFPLQVVAPSSAVGTIAFSASANAMQAATIDADGDPMTSVQVPIVQKVAANGGVVRAGVITAQIQNAIDLYGQGMYIEVESGTTLNLYLGGCRLYKGAQLLIEEVGENECSGAINASIAESVSSWLNGDTYTLARGGKWSFEVAAGIDALQLAGDYMTLANVSISADAGRTAHLRLRVTDIAAQSGTGISNLAISYPDAASVRLTGTNDNGDVLSVVTFGAATSSRAGVMRASDKSKLDSLPTAEQIAAQISGFVAAQDAVGSLQVSTPTTTTISITYGTAEPTPSYKGSISLPAATTSKAGLMSAADANKLAGIAAGAEVNAIDTLLYDATSNPDSAASENVSIINKIADLNTALGGSFVNGALPTTGSLEGRAMPKNGCNYNIGNISSLLFDNNMAAMTLGCTIHFVATANFIVVLPYTHAIGGVDTAPTYPCRMADAESFVCETGKEYEIDITAVCGVGNTPINVFSLHELNTPDATSNGL